MPEPMMISTIIPAYNAAETLAETLDSIAAQTLATDEVIVVDDGSGDSTPRLAGAHPLRPTVLAKPHSGAASSLNLGIGGARGSYLAFLDADDLWTPDKLRMQYDFLDAHPEIGGVTGLVVQFASPGMADAEAGRFVIPAEPQPGWLSGALLVRASVFSRVGAFSEDLSNGFVIDWFDRARSAGIRFHMLREVLLRRRIRAGSLAARNSGSDAAMLEMARRAILRRRKVD
jgi:glycosyltransferase involved in cell wall biosynthesis